MNKFKLFASLSLFCLSVSSTLAQERKIEENLVFSDPTVAKQQDEWSGGIFLDAMRTARDIKVYDTSGGSSSATASSTKVGFSAYVGKGDISYLFSYHPAGGSVIVASTGHTSSVPITTKTDLYEFNVRYLDKANASWYIPYYLAGFAYLKNTWTIPDVVINGVTEVNTNQGIVPEVGIGVIIPRSAKYGYRFDVRLMYGTWRYGSTLFSQWNGKDTSGELRPTATVYYNLTDNINLQAGAQYDTFQQGKGLYFQLGTKF